MSTEWWRSAVFYQVYPRSFADGNGDGQGDLPGLIDRLDYLQWLGIDAIWLSPFHPSPNDDWGYDVSDYRGVHPDFGTMDDFGALLDGAHRRGIRVIGDLVMNHTSDQHPWFVESRSSTDNPKRDWYVWHDGDEPPTNWVSVFGGPAWTRDEATGEWYYHFFLPSQPDLNWRNPEVVAAMWDVVRFWLDLGLDGFRLDAVGVIFEDPAMRDHTADFEMIHLVNDRLDPSPRYGDKWKNLLGRQLDLPELHDVMKDLRRVVDEYDDRVLIGEADDIAYYGDGTDELHLVFNFPLMRTESIDAAHVIENQRERHAALPPTAWPCTTLGNHDASRVRTSFGTPPDDLAQARLWAALPLLLQGTPVLYYGEEIGMEDYPFSEVDQLRDPIGAWFFRDAREILGMTPAEAEARALVFSRDRCRTPMQWAAAPNGGFCPGGVEPWLPVHPNHRDGITVADQRDDPGSLLSWYRRLLHLRRDHLPLTLGAYEALSSPDDPVLVFSRTLDDDRLIVAMNFAGTTRPVDLPAGCTDLLEPGGDGEIGPWGVRVLA